MTSRLPSEPMQSLIGDLHHVMKQQDAHQGARRARARWGIPAIALVSVVGAGAAVAAVSGVFTVEKSGDFAIQTRPSAGHTLCLELNARGARRATYGCGTVPTAEKPFGLLVVDRSLSTDQNLSRDVVYGVVADTVRSVDLGGRTAATREVAGIPGRYFSMQLSGLQKVRAIAHAADGSVLGQLGDTAPANAGRPQNIEEDRAQGNLSGFAPGVELPTLMTYHGKPVTAEQIVAKKLSCTEDNTTTMVCKDR